jgi:hypothetical protein
MVCPCCVQCGIKSLTDSVSVTFTSTFRPWWEGSDPCYSPVSIYLCPWSITNETFATAFSVLNDARNPLPDPEGSPNSGSCNKYDGTHVIDYADNSAQPSDLSNGWCTSAGTFACPRSFRSHWHQWNSSGYEASCSGVRAWHSMIGRENIRWFIARIESVPAGGTFNPPEAGRTQYTVIEGPTTLSTIAGRDWLKVRYSFVQRAVGPFDSYNDSNARDTFAHCLAQCPQLELG